jgi:CubicO group peptidase (beta-lactamase class C family)
LKKLDRYIHILIDEGIIPGLTIGCCKDNKILIQERIGFKSIFPQRAKIERDTLYDVASLTKPLVTAFIFLYLKEKNKLPLDNSVKKFLNDFPYDITLCQLLTHTSGLPAWYPLYLYSNDYWSQIKTLKLESKPGKKVNYSCLGYIVLFYILQKICGDSYQRLAQNIIFDPLGLKNTFLKVPEEQKKRAAPTERGNVYEKELAEKKHYIASQKFKWRDYVLQGETHDCNSWYLGGTAGNSGLFTTLEDLLHLSREFFPETATLLSPESVQLFWKNFTLFKASHRTIGFKLNSSFITSGGRSLSRHAIGHNGFTGTSIWLEPETRRVFVLLSNRIQASSYLNMVDNNGKVAKAYDKKINFNKVRRKLHRLMVAEL